MLGVKAVEAKALVSALPLVKALNIVVLPLLGSPMTQISKNNLLCLAEI
jgi:hypothetical protein